MTDGIKSLFRLYEWNQTTTGYGWSTVILVLGSEELSWWTNCHVSVRFLPNRNNTNVLFYCGKSVQHCKILVFQR
jgi:hypothetical protein